MMLTNSSWGVLPVTRIESKQIGAGAPGEAAMRLRRLWLDEVESGPQPTPQTDQGGSNCTLS